MTDPTMPPVPPSAMEPRLIAVAAMVARGESDKRIASALNVSLRMVQHYIVAVAYWCDADPERNTRVQIATWYRRHVPIHVHSEHDDAIAISGNVAFAKSA